mgnify:FL=1
MTPKDPRKIAADVLLQVEEGAYSHLALKDALKDESLRGLDRAFITELVYGVTRRKLTLDHIIDSHLKKRDLRPEIRTVLRMGAYQLLYMDRVPASAAVNESVKLVHIFRLNSQKGLVNAVLRNVDRSRDRDYFSEIREPAARLAALHSHPVWMVRMFLNRFGEASTRKLLEYNNGSQPNYARVNTLKTGRDELIRLVQDQGGEAVPGVVPGSIILTGKTRPGSLPAYRDGLFMLQSPSSMVAALALGARPGEKVLDCCAAPGGKTFILAQEMNNQGELLATDVHPHKITLINRGTGFLGIQCARARVADWEQPQPALGQDFDRVLVDAPCSGLGVLGRRPDSRWRKESKDIPGLVAVQRKILTNAWEAVRPGGVLLYSTCTLTLEENQMQRQWALDNLSGAGIRPLEVDLPVLSQQDRQNLSEGWLEILPFRHNLDGFYLAALEKKA